MALNFTGDGPKANSERIKQLYTELGVPLSKIDMEETGLSYNQVKAALQYLVRNEQWIGVRDEREDRNTLVYRPALTADEARDYTMGAHAKGLSTNIETYVKTLAPWVEDNVNVDPTTRHRYDSTALALAAMNSTLTLQAEHEQEMARMTTEFKRKIRKLERQRDAANARARAKRTT